MTLPGDLPAIIVIGRKDKTRKSDTILRIAERLRRRGHAVHWFESERHRASQRINEAIARAWPRLARSPKDLPGHLRLLRFVVKAAFVLIDRHRRDFLRAALWSDAVISARELCRFLESLPAAKAHLITHSAGGIAATKAAAARIPASGRIGGIICFGYPFQHPDRHPQGYRTRHLASIDKPLLMLQGNSDIYGCDPAWFGRFLPAPASITMLDSDHDYSALPPGEFDRAWRAVAEFLSTENVTGPGR